MGHSCPNHQFLQEFPAGDGGNVWIRHSSFATVNPIVLKFHGRLQLKIFLVVKKHAPESIIRGFSEQFWANSLPILPVLFVRSWHFLTFLPAQFRVFPMILAAVHSIMSISWAIFRTDSLGFLPNLLLMRICALDSRRLFPPRSFFFDS